MTSAAQARALENYRKRLSKRGLARFEVLGLDSDRELVRALARRLAENDPDSEEIRVSLQRSTSSGPGRKGGVLAALRSWPLADLKLTRPTSEGRKIEL
jgi:hypothetical protein